MTSRTGRAGRAATFFLDSVDESKLNGAEDFYSALKHFREALPADFGARARILLSSRISEWHPETDGATRARSIWASEAAWKKPSRTTTKETSTTKPAEDDLLVSRSSARPRAGRELLRAKDYGRVEEFIAELDRAHAWEFARRPIDVVALAISGSRNDGSAP